MRAAVSEHLNPVSRLVGEYLTLDEMREQGWNVPRRLLRERLPIEYPTVQAMYESGFTIPRSTLKRKLTIDPATIKRGRDITLTPEEIDSIAADILLYGVPDEYITNPDLYEGLPNWLQLVILDAVINEMSTDMIRKFFSGRMARPGEPRDIFGMNKDRADLMPQIAKLMYEHKILNKHPQLWSIMFDQAALADMYQVVGGIMRAGYQPSFTELVRLRKAPFLLNQALDRIRPTFMIPLDDFIGTMESLQNAKIKTPKLVKLFAERRDELLKITNRVIAINEGVNRMLKSDIDNIKATAGKRPLSVVEQYNIAELERKIKRNDESIEDERNRVMKLITYWS